MKLCCLTDLVAVVESKMNFWWCTGTRNRSVVLRELRVKVKVAQLCPTLCHRVDCSLPGSFVHGIPQARILEWVAISFSRGSFQPRDQTQVCLITGRFFTVWATRKTWHSPVFALSSLSFLPFLRPRVSSEPCSLCVKPPVCFSFQSTILRCFSGNPGP